jgi:deoxyribodipyrimidine photo-lyase
VPQVKEVAFEELQTQDRVEKELEKINCLLETYSTSTLYHPQDLPFTINDIPDILVFYKYRTFD